MTTFLRLYGQFSYIADNKLEFALIRGEDTHEETFDKLQGYAARCGDTSVNLARPYSRAGFTVHLPRGIKGIPPDIAASVGHACSVLVAPSTYTFKSRMPHNRGVTITGIKLVLQELRKQ